MSEAATAPRCGRGLLVRPDRRSRPRPAGVIALAFTSKQISDRKSEVAKLQAQAQQAEAKAQSLQAFANFRAVQEQRSSTITSLAQSRFDWQRVLNELSRVVPSNVWLVQLAGHRQPPGLRSRRARDPDPGRRHGSRTRAGRLRAQPGRGRRTRSPPGGDRRRHARRPPAVGEGRGQRLRQRRLGLLRLGISTPRPSAGRTTSSPSSRSSSLSTRFPFPRARRRRHPYRLRWPRRRPRRSPPSPPRPQRREADHEGER